MKITEPFRAYRVHADEGVHRANFETLSLDALSAGNVVIEAHYSSINYKDALAATGRGKILRRSPLIGGIDVSGVVAASEDPRFKPGDPVLVTGCGLSETHDGGFAQYVRVVGDWVVPIPEGLDPYVAMAIGTAGFSAALAVQRLEDNHQTPDLGPVLVTGATGGVGSLAISILSGLGYEVVALSGKPQRTDYLKSIGAASVIDRHQLNLGKRPLEKALWGGAIDNVGGEILGWLTRTVRPWGSIASIGLVASASLEISVMPFILRGVSLIGVSSADCPLAWRPGIWQRLAKEFYPRHIDQIVSQVVAFDDLPGAFEALLAGEHWGRTVVKIKE